MNKTRLQAKVQARNLANGTALVYAPIILEALKPFLGKAIVLQTGCKSAKLCKALEALNLPEGIHGDGSVQIFIKAERHWFRAEVRVCVHHDRGCVYESQTINLGDIDGATLKAIAEAPSADYCRTDYSAEEILAARAAVKSVREELQQAERRLAGFGEHDNN